MKLFRKDSYVRTWLHHAWEICNNELKMIFPDGGAIIIFFVGGLLYPVLYNYVYGVGMVDDMPVAVVDMCHSSDSRRFINKVDATRECEIAYDCIDMLEAEKLMQEQKVHGIIYIPSDFSEKLAHLEQATVSTYADMSSFLYYKCLTMGTSYVMLDELKTIQAEHYAAAGFSGEDAAMLIEPVRREENIPYNPAFSYTIFFLAAALMLAIQQTLFYGSALLAGTLREQNRSFASLPDRLQGVGMGRVVLGRAAAYMMVYTFVGTVVLFLVPWLFHYPQRADMWEVFILMLFFVADCIFFSFTWSTLIRRRETVFVLFLFMSPVLMFLSGVTWPESAFPDLWRWFSYLFPSTFGCRAFMNLNTAGGTIVTIAPQLFWITIQTVVYYMTANIAVFVENRVIKRRAERQALRDRIAERLGIDRDKDAYIIGGKEGVERLRQRREGKIG